MSQWTAVNGIIRLSTPGGTSPETLYIAQTVIDHLPKITGSEENIHMHLQLAAGTNCSSETDEQNHPVYSQNEPFTWQSDCILSLYGHLRDRLFLDTLKETNHMLSVLASRLSIAECLVCVEGQGNMQILHNPDHLRSMPYTDWVKKHIWERTPS